MSAPLRDITEDAVWQTVQAVVQELEEQVRLAHLYELRATGQSDGSAATLADVQQWLAALHDEQIIPGSDARRMIRETADVLRTMNELQAHARQSLEAAQKSQARAEAQSLILARLLSATVPTEAVPSPKARRPARRRGG